jgi:hypothetical protein
VLVAMFNARNETDRGTFERNHPVRDDRENHSDNRGSQNHPGQNGGWGRSDTRPGQHQDRNGPVSVPEPSSLLLTGTGLIWLASVGRRRTRS